MIRRVLTVGGRIAYWLGWPFWHVLLARSQRTRVVIVKGGEVLLVKSHLGAGRWGLPGGGMAKGESPEDCAIREIQEEVAITLARTSLISFGKHRVSYHGHSYPAYFFGAEVPPETHIHPHLYEISAAEWFPFATVYKAVDVEAVHAQLRNWFVA